MSWASVHDDDASSAARLAVHPMAFWLALGLTCLLALLLRFAGAAGDLWLDEAWSFHLLEPVTSIDRIFWAINHDNNHFLNSVWLYLVGPDASPTAARALSIALGAAAVPVAAIAARGGRATMLATALLFAASTIMVHYGSEARGYSGLVLFTLAAVALVQRTLDGSARPLAFAAIVLLGFLSHLTFAASVAVLVAWVAVVLWQRSRSLQTVNVEVGSIFGPAFLAVIPLALCMLVGRAIHGFEIGGIKPFTLDGFLAGLGGAFRHALGLPHWVPDLAIVAAVFILVLASPRFWPTRRSALYLAGIVALPLLMALAHLPNIHFPRYFLVSATLLLLWLGETLGRAIEAGGPRRVAALAVLALFLAGNATALDTLFDHGRGTFRPIVERIAASGDPRYGASHATRIPIVVDLLARSHDRVVRLVPAEELCAARPLWFIVDGQEEPPTRIVPDAACGTGYDLVEAHGPAPLAGSDWALYRLAGP